jgi:hypothetical protein
MFNGFEAGDGVVVVERSQQFKNSFWKGDLSIEEGKEATILKSIQ